MSKSHLFHLSPEKNVEINKMSKEKILSYAATAIEITKMVLVISAKTAVKLFYEGKNEVIKQYAEYNQKSYYKQKETVEKLRALTDKASSIKPPAPANKLNSKGSKPKEEVKKPK